MHNPPTFCRATFNSHSVVKNSSSDKAGICSHTDKVITVIFVSAIKTEVQYSFFFYTGLVVIQANENDYWSNKSATAVISCYIVYIKQFPSIIVDRNRTCLQLYQNINHVNKYTSTNVSI